MNYKTISIRDVINNNCDIYYTKNSKTKTIIKNKISVFDKFKYDYKNYRCINDINLFYNPPEKYMFFHKEKITNSEISQDENEKYLFYNSDSFNVFTVLFETLLNKIYNTNIENYFIELLQKYHYKSHRNNCNKNTNVINTILFEKKLLSVLDRVIDFTHMKIYMSCITFIKDNKFHYINHLKDNIDREYINTNNIRSLRINLCINLYKNQLFNKKEIQI